MQRPTPTAPRAVPGRTIEMPDISRGYAHGTTRTDGGDIHEGARRNQPDGNDCLATAAAVAGTGVTVVGNVTLTGALTGFPSGSPSTTAGASTTRCFGRCCTASIWKRPHSNGTDRQRA
jgi:hypothetical protein